VKRRFAYMYLPCEFYTRATRAQVHVSNVACPIRRFSVPTFGAWEVDGTKRRSSEPRLSHAPVLPYSKHSPPNTLKTKCYQNYVYFPQHCPGNVEAFGRMLARPSAPSSAQDTFQRTCVRRVSPTRGSGMRRRTLFADRKRRRRGRGTKRIHCSSSKGPRTGRWRGYGNKYVNVAICTCRPYPVTCIVSLGHAVSHVSLAWAIRHFVFVRYLLSERTSKHESSTCSRQKSKVANVRTWYRMVIPGRGSVEDSSYIVDRSRTAVLHCRLTVADAEGIVQALLDVSLKAFKSYMDAICSLCAWCCAQLSTVASSSLPGRTSTAGYPDMLGTSKSADCSQVTSACIIETAHSS
jgi:hypothetical protein